MTQSTSHPAQTLTSFLRRMRAVREFTSEPIADDVLQDILEVGRWSATGGNRQQVELVVIRDPAVKQKFAEWGARPAGPAACVFLLVGSSEGTAFDEGRMAERLALAAAAHGLGSVIATLKEQGPANAKALLGIPSEKHAVYVVPIGHIDREARKNLPANPNGGRKPMSEYAHQERY